MSHSVSVYLEMATLLLSSHSTCYYRWNYSGPLHHLHQHSETSTRVRDWYLTYNTNCFYENIYWNTVRKMIEDETSSSF